MQITATLPREGIFEPIVDDENRLRALRNGQWLPHDRARAISIGSPVDGSLVGEVPALSREEIDEVFQRAQAAQPGWAETSLEERAQCLYRTAQLLEENCDALVNILMREIAKARKDAQDEVLRSAEYIRFTVEEGRRLKGEMMMGDSYSAANRKKMALVYRAPLGVVLAISPFNYPLNLAVTKMAPALIAGNTVVLKPPTQGSIIGTYLVRVFQAAGFPLGAVQVVTGRGSEIGDYLTTHPLVNMIALTGSTAVGLRAAKLAGMIPLMKELGGKNAAIVLDDADMTLAAKEVVSGAFAYAGQRCTAMNRVIATEAAADALLEELMPLVEKVKAGRPEEEGVTVIPLISHESADYVQELIDDALAKGATLLIGNEREGNLLWPTVIDRVTEDMRLAWEEQFGPVLPIIRVKDAQEAVRIANKSEYGLQSAVFTGNLDLAVSVAHALEVGTVQINGRTARGPDHFLFIGCKASGMGAQGVRYAIEAMTRLKSIVFNFQGWQGFTGL